MCEEELALEKQQNIRNVKSVELLLECSNVKQDIRAKSDTDYLTNQDLSDLKYPDLSSLQLPLANSFHPPNHVTSDLHQELSNKNRAIELLKRRLTNQQIQLGYYLHKNLATEAVLEFSNKCVPHLAEDSTQLSLAMYKFIRDTGGKTRLAQLREKLTDYNNRVHKVLLRQEQLIRQGFGFDKSSALKPDGESDDEEKQAHTYRTVKLELCSQLLGITLHVRKELEQFRVCAENIVRLEEERNALVDRVFSLPPEQRYGNVHVSVVEKKDSTASPSRSTTSVSTNTTMDVDETKPSLGGALQDMESEAIQLLLLSEKQKNEFVIALDEARVENQQLKERLRAMEEAASDERVIYLQEKCDTIEREVDSLKRHLETEQNEKEQIIKQVETELENREMRENELKIEMKKLTASLEVIKSEKHFLQKQLDSSKTQNTSTHEISSSNSHKDVEDLADLVVMQEEQIKDLLSIMSDIQIDRDSSVASTEQLIHSPIQESMAGDTEKEEEDIGTSDTHGNDNIENSETPGSGVDVDVDVDQKEIGDEYQIYYDSTSEFTTNQEYSDDGRTEQKDIPSESKESKKSISKSSVKRTRRVSRVRSVTPKMHANKKVSQHVHRYHSSGVATTSLRVQAFDKDGKSESMHAVLECSSPVDGLLEMNNASKLHLRLQCTSPQRRAYTDSRVSGRTETTQESSVPYSEKLVSGDHPRSATHPHLSLDTKLYLAEQLNKIKSQLETASSVDVRKEIVHNLNDLCSQLFDDDNMTDSTARS